MRWKHILALVPLAIALLIEATDPELMGAYHWFLFYPAAFFSSWIGGRWLGLVGTVVTTALVYWFFIPPEHTLAKEPHEYMPAAVFLMMGSFFAVFHDRLKTANASLQKLLEERRVFSALIENSSDFIGIADASGTPIYVNPAGRRMVGLAPDADVGKTEIPDYYPADQRDFVTNVIVRSMVEKGRWEGETYFRNFQTDQPIPVSDEHFIIREPGDGRVLGMGTVTRDISDLRRARDEIEAANRKLKELDELKTHFFENVSHELRTPLALILGPVRALLESPDVVAEAARHDLEIVERNADLLLGHVNDLLDVAKLDAGAMKVDYAECNVARLVRFVAGHFETISVDTGVALDVETPERLTGEIDPEKVRRVVFNLLSNAFKFTPRGGRVRVALRERGDDRFAIEVADTGPGIPADKRAQVFERFRQLEGGSTRRFGGTGLGLSIAQELTVLHGGRITVGDAPEGGALFVAEMARLAPMGASVRAPAAEETAAPPKSSRRIAAAREILRAPADAPLALVVEDNADMSEFVASGLADRYRVVTAVDGRDGIAKAIELRPDVILTDLMMPDVSGESLVRELRDRRELDATPIVVLTAKAHESLRVKLLQEGATDYLVKPFTLPELRARVSNLVHLKQANEALERALSARDEVLGVVAHDLRNPLNTIALHATLLQRSTAQQHDSGTIDAIRRAATRMNRLIQDLLDVSRLEAGHALSITPAPLSPASVVQNVVDAHAPNATAASVELVSEVGVVANVAGDRDRILQVFDNLVSNALKFTPAKGRVTISAEQHDDEVVFCVSDTGRGLPPEASEHLFERFWQASADRRGTGLGLSVAKAIVEGHGGRIWADSRPGEGTRVYFTIPTVASAHKLAV